MKVVKALRAQERLQESEVVVVVPLWSTPSTLTSPNNPSLWTTTPLQ